MELCLRITRLMTETITIEREGLLRYIDPSVISTTKFHKLSHPYENGVFITIHNHKCMSADIYEGLPSLYKELYGLLAGKDSKDLTSRVYKVRDKNDIPTQKNLLDLCYNRVPTLVCGIHNYDPYDVETGRGSSSNYGYQHTHLYLYGAHYHLEPKDIPTWEKKAKRLLKKNYSNNSKVGKDRLIDIRTVGGGKYCYGDTITPTTLHNYLLTPYTNSEKHCLINYISKNKQHYPLSIITGGIKK